MPDAPATPSTTEMIWALQDDRTGHNAQVLGLLERLGLPYEVKPLYYNHLASLPNGLLGPRLWHIGNKAVIGPPWPRAVIASGRRTSLVARYIKRQSPTTRIIQLMWPGLSSAREFDLLVTPQHDAPPPLPNIVTTMGVLHGITDDKLREQGGKWHAEFAKLPKPWVALLLGGDSKHGAFSTEDFQRLFTHAQRLAINGSLLITTSRRTPHAQIEELLKTVETPHYYYRWTPKSENPYLGLLALADGIIVTGDSLSMCCEAAFTGKPLFISNPSSLMSPRHLELQRQLIQRGCARMLGAESRLDWEPKLTLDEAEKAANRVKECLKNAA